MNYFPFHIGDYTSHTAHLEPMEDLAYRRMLDVYYVRESALPADQVEVARLVRMRDHVDAVSVVLAEFFKLTDAGWVNERADSEIESMRDKQQKQRDKAAKRWQKPAQEHGNAGAMPDECHGNAAAVPQHNHGSADAMPPTPTPTPTPTPLLTTFVVGGAAQSAAPTTPPDFDGQNAATLNGKAVVKLAEAWELPEQWGMDAEALGFPVSTVIRESEKFRQYWVSGKGAGTRRSVKGWRQTWSNWLEKAARDAR